jgi:hypothetical protein
MNKQDMVMSLSIGQRTNPDPARLDIALDGNGYMLHCDAVPVRTRGGKPCESRDRGLLQDVLVQLAGIDRQNASPFDAPELFSVQKDLVEDGDADASILALFDHDPMVVMRTGAAGMAPDEDDMAMMCSIEVLPSVMQAWSQLMQESNKLLADMLGSRMAELKSFTKERWYSHGPRNKSVMLQMARYHGTGLVLPLLLVERRITATAYASAGLVMRNRGLLCDGSEMPSWFRMDAEQTAGPEENAMLRLRLDAQAGMQYAIDTWKQDEEADTLTWILRQGESFHQEFKSTLRWNIKAEKKDPAIEHAALKTIAAFLNSDGGNLVIGVADDASAVGIELDDFPNIDKFSLHFWNLVKSSFGQDISPFIETDFHTMEGKTVCVVRCARCTRPAFLRQKGFDEEFYIRVGPGSASMNISEALRYIADRFSGMDRAV